MICRIAAKASLMTTSPVVQDTHSKTMGYLLWIFGFIGAHRFYYGRPISGTLYFFTLLGLFMKLVEDLTYVFVDPRIDFESRDS